MITNNNKMSTKFINLAENNLDKIDWFSLSLNSNAIEFLENNQDKINWRGLSCNLNPYAIPLLEKN